MPLIAVLVPVFGRPQNALSVAASLRATSDARLVFLANRGDDDQIVACVRAVRDVGQPAEVVVVPWANGPHDYPRKMNHGYRITAEPWLLLAADDVAFEDGWDDRALAYGETGLVSVIGTNDRANPQVMRGEFATHALVRRAYVDTAGASADGPGVLIHEGYDHNYCDRELCHLAQSRGVWAFAPDAVIRHRHPCWGTAPKDATYARGAASMGVDHQLLYDRAALWGYDGLGLAERRSAQRHRRRSARRTVAGRRP